MHDPGYLERLSDAMDRLAWGGPELMQSPEFATQLADLRGYFLYLTLDALEDRKLARELVRSFEGLEARAEPHSKFFFTLRQLLSARRWIAKLPEEEEERKAFERSFKRTAAQLGL